MLAATSRSSVGGEAAGRVGRLAAHLDGSAAFILLVQTPGLADVARSFGAALGARARDAVRDRLVSLDRDGVLAEEGPADFLLVLPAREAADALALRAEKRMNGAYLLEGRVLELPASIGIVETPAHGSDAAMLLSRAAIAVRASTAQRPTVAFRFELESAEQEALSLRNALAGALLKQEFELFFQPQCEVRSGATIGFEALLRWRRPGIGVVGPGAFVGGLEASGLITRVGDWIIRDACEKAARWPEHISVAVNVSPAQLSGGSLVSTVISALATSGLAPHRLELEVTESSLIGNADGALELFKLLRAQGVRLSLDDFGTGYSSLSYLKKFPFNKIKIDQSFVRDAEADDAILAAIVQIGRALRMSTIAEGVETKEQLAIVANAGCSALQGYLVSKPLPFEDASRFVLTNHHWSANP